MNNETDIRFVNTHTEGICADHHTDLAVFPLNLSVIPAVRSQTRMIERRTDSVGRKICRKFFSLLSAADIYDSSSGDVRTYVEHLSEFVLTITYDI